MQTAEQTYLEERKKARSAQESLSDQPENTEAVEVSGDAPIDNVVELEAKADEEITEEIEESENEEVSEATQTDTEEDLYVEYKGREINLRDQPQHWKYSALGLT